MSSFYIDPNTEDKLKLTNIEGKSIRIKSSKRLNKLKKMSTINNYSLSNTNANDPSNFTGLWIPDDPNSYVIYITNNTGPGPVYLIFFGKKSVIYNKVDPNTSSGYLYLTNMGFKAMMGSVLTVGRNNTLTLSSSFDTMTINNNIIFPDGIWRKSYICNNWKNKDGILINIFCDQVDPEKFNNKPYFNIMVSVGSVKLLGMMSYDVLTSTNSIKSVNLTHLSYNEDELQPITDFYSNLFNKDWIYDINQNNLSVGILDGNEYIKSIFTPYNPIPVTILYVSSGIYVSQYGDNINITGDGNTITAFYMQNQIDGNYDKKTGIIKFNDGSIGTFSSDFWTLFAFGLSFNGQQGLQLGTYR